MMKIHICRESKWLTILSTKKILGIFCWVLWIITIIYMHGICFDNFLDLYFFSDIELYYELR